MGEDEDLGWFPEYLKVKEFIPPKGTEIIPKEEFMKELVGKPLDVEFDITNCKVSYKDGMIVVDELTKCPIGVVAPQNDGIKPLSENTAQRLDKAFKDLRKAVGGFPFFTLLSKRKARKHYKPKFTL